MTVTVSIDTEREPELAKFFNRAVAAVRAPIERRCGGGRRTPASPALVLLSVFSRPRSTRPR